MSYKSSELVQTMLKLMTEKLEELGLGSYTDELEIATRAELSKMAHRHCDKTIDNLKLAVKLAKESGFDSDECADQAHAAVWKLWCRLGEHNHRLEMEMGDKQGESG